MYKKKENKKIDIQFQTFLLTILNYLNFRNFLYSKI